MLLIAYTAHHAYAVRANDLLMIAPYTPEQQSLVAAGRRCETVALGPLLDPSDQSVQPRRALLVALRRRMVGLLVEAVAEAEPAPLLALPSLLQDRLRQPVTLGTIWQADQLLVVLDIRALTMRYLVEQAR